MKKIFVLFPLLVFAYTHGAVRAIANPNLTQLGTWDTTTIKSFVHTIAGQDSDYTDLSLNNYSTTVQTRQIVSDTMHSASGLFAGTAAKATIFATGRTLGITGDATWTSPSFNGSANVTAALTLATVASAGTTGSSTAIPVITINAKGLTTSITTVAVVAPAGTLSGNTLAAGVTASSLTSVGALNGLTVINTATITNVAGMAGDEAILRLSTTSINWGSAQAAMIRAHLINATTGANRLDFSLLSNGAGNDIVRLSIDGETGVVSAPYGFSGTLSGSITATALSITDANTRIFSASTTLARGYTFSSPNSNFGPQVSGMYFTPRDGVSAVADFTVNLWDGTTSNFDRMFINGANGTVKIPAYAGTGSRFACFDPTGYLEVGATTCVGL